MFVVNMSLCGRDGARDVFFGDGRQIFRAGAYALYIIRNTRGSVVGCRLSGRWSVVGCRLSVVGCRVDGRLSVVGCRLSVVGCRVDVRIIPPRQNG